MSQLVFGSPEANAIVAQRKRVEAMPESIRESFMPESLQGQLAEVEREIISLERELTKAQNRRGVIQRELRAWGIA